MNEDDYWRQQSDEDVPVRETVAAGAYDGPPREAVPPHLWHPDLVITTPTPRSLPFVDDDAMDDDEDRARRFTVAVGLTAGAIVLLLAVSRLLS